MTKRHFTMTSKVARVREKFFLRNVFYVLQRLVNVINYVISLKWMINYLKVAKCTLRLVFLW